MIAVPPLEQALPNKVNSGTIPRFRRSLFLSDFKEAQRFATFILEKKLHDKKQTDYVKLLHSAFNTSLIISYCRPFTRNENRPGEASSTLSPVVNIALNEDEITLHKMIRERRNQVHAHTQAGPRLIGGMDYERDFFFMRVVAPLSKSEIRTLQKIIKKWIRFLSTN